MPTIIEAFVTDPGFIDETKTINGMFVDEVGAIGTLNQKALSYFTLPSSFSDRRSPDVREVTWVAETSPQVIVDKHTYSTFVDDVNALPPSASNAFFKLVDKLLFNYDASITREDLEADLVTDVDISDIYVPESFERSATIVEDDIYYKLGTSTVVSVPSFIKFSIEIPAGSETEIYTITLFAAVEAWLTGYDISTIAKVIPPLPYERLYGASLSNTVDNIFTTAATTQLINYNTTKDILGTTGISGTTEFNAVLVDQLNNTVSIPFNILFKGRTPTLTEIRQAIREELLSSGVGNEAGWEARIPGVFVAGRFYVVPYWDLFITKPDQVIYPSIQNYNVLGDKITKLMDAVGFNNIIEYVDIFSVYYNTMTVAAVPDLTGVVDIQTLQTIIPDYQSFSPDEENYAYMTESTRGFVDELNRILAIEMGAAPVGTYSKITENLLTFYSFVVGKFEVCVVTKENYETIMESIQ